MAALSQASHLEIQSSQLFINACGELGCDVHPRIFLEGVYKGGGDGNNVINTKHVS